MRYKQPEGDQSVKVEFPVAAEAKRMDQTSDDFRFAAAVAGFGMMLRDSAHKAGLSYDQVLNLAASAAEDDPDAYRAEFIRLVKQAQKLSTHR